MKCISIQITIKVFPPLYFQVITLSADPEKSNAEIEKLKKAQAELEVSRALMWMICYDTSKVGSLC